MLAAASSAEIHVPACTPPRSVKNISASYFLPSSTGEKFAGRTAAVGVAVGGTDEVDEGVSVGYEGGTPVGRSLAATGVVENDMVGSALEVTVAGVLLEETGFTFVSAAEVAISLGPPGICEQAETEKSKIHNVRIRKRSITDLLSNAPRTAVPVDLFQQKAQPFGWAS